MMITRVIPSVVIAASLCAGTVLPTEAQPYPVRPITVIVPLAAGGGSDTIARIVSEHMAKTLGQPLIIENIPGAGGTIGSARAAKAVPDGYTIIIGQMGTHGAAPALHARLTYDPAKDFSPIGLTAGQPMVIVTRKNFPASNLKDFIEFTRKNQAKISEAHSGIGTASEAVCKLLQSIIGVETARVAYRGANPAVIDVVSGQLDFGCFSLANVASQIQSGTLKGIVIASAERAEAISGVPTAKESGLPEFEASNWNAFFAPRNLPQVIQTQLNDAVAKALDDESTRKRLLDIGCEIPGKGERTPQALQKLVESEVARWLLLLKPMGASAN